MTRVLLFTTLLCAVGTTQASAQNEVSQQLLELDEDDRNTFFTLLLRGSNRQCDQVIRTLLKNAYLGMDEWEALCRDRNSYSFSIPADPEATITSLNCRELLATSKMMLQSVGSKSKARGCKIKRKRRERDYIPCAIIVTDGVAEKAWQEIFSATHGCAMHTPSTAARAAGVAKSTIYRAIKTGRVPAHQLHNGKYAIYPV